MNLAYVIAAALVAVLIYLGIRYFVRSSKRFGGAQVIVCPDTASRRPSAI